MNKVQFTNELNPNSLSLLTLFFSYFLFCSLQKAELHVIPHLARRQRQPKANSVLIPIQHSIYEHTIRHILHRIFIIASITLIIYKQCILKIYIINIVQIWILLWKLVFVLDNRASGTTCHKPRCRSWYYLLFVKIILSWETRGYYKGCIFSNFM